MKVYLVFLTIVLSIAQNISYAQVQSGSFEFEGNMREYHVFLPQNYQPNMPVVFNLAGYTTTALWQMNYSGMNSVADTAGFIVVYPEPVLPGFNSGLKGYPGFPPLPEVDDVGFISALIDTLEAHYNIDMARIYCTGQSNGGIMTSRLACELGHRFAAAATNVGVFNDYLGIHCDPIRPIPILYIHGTADEIAPYEGGIANIWPAESTLNFWVQNNNCSSPPDTVLLPDLDPNDGCTVQKISYTNCSETSKVIFYKVINGGHGWPGSTYVPDWAVPTNNDINASVEFWNFFKNYENTSHSSVGGKTTELPESFALHQNYPNPFNPKTTIQYQLPKSTHVKLLIHNLLGQLVTTLINEKKTIGMYKVEWDGKDSMGREVTSGIYLYRLETKEFVKVRKLTLLR